MHLLDKETEAAESLAPLTGKALELSLEAYAGLCERIERGEEMDQGPFQEVVGVMRDILLGSTEFRWPRTRAYVNGLFELMKRHEATGGGYVPDVRGIRGELLEGRNHLQGTLRDELPLGISQSRQRVSQRATKAAEEHIKRENLVRA